MSGVTRFLDLLRRGFDRLVLISNAVASAWIFVMMALITLDIVMRFVFNAPISGVNEIVEISIVTILYLQLAHTLKAGRITRSDALHGRILRRVPMLGNAMGAIFNAAGMGLAVAIMIEGWPKWIQAWEGNFYVGNVGVFTFPEWPQRLVLVVGCGLLAIQFALAVIDHVRALFALPPLEHAVAIGDGTDLPGESRQ